MRKIAVVDMGTNTFHLLIASVQNGEYKVLLDHKQAVGLGRGGINDGRMTSEAMDRALNALKVFRQTCQELEVDRVLLTGTSAVRSAENKDEFLSRIQTEIGWKTMVITGEQEAAWIYEGVKSSGVIPAEGSSLLVDIGGGSVEFVLCTPDKILWKQSFEIGGQRLMDKFRHNDPIRQDEITHIRNYLEEMLIPLWQGVKANGGAQTLIGSSGSFDTLCEIYCRKENIVLPAHTKGYTLPFEEFQLIAKDLLAKDRAQRLATPGMIELRVDMIVVSLVLIETLVEKLGIQKIEVSFYALKEGLMNLMVSGKL